jgi:hypothetical protein
MRIIYKYELEPGGSTTISLPFNSRVLTVQEQRGKLVMWVLVDTSQGTGNRNFYTYPTGEPLLNCVEAMKWIATVQMSNGLVYHVFE